MNNTTRFPGVVAFALFLAWNICPLSALQEPPPQLAGFSEIENLPLLRTGIQTRQFAAYDRSGDNYDWDYFVLYTERNGEAVMELLRDLHQAGATVCMVTHDDRYARHAERTIHLFDGRIVDESGEQG